MSSHLVPAAAGGLPALPPFLAALAEPGVCPYGVFLVTLPTWMDFRIEAHRDALKALGIAAREVSILGDASLAMNCESPPAWLLEAEQAHDGAQDRERDTFALLLAERPRSDRDATARTVYLAGLTMGGEA